MLKGLRTEARDKPTFWSWAEAEELKESRRNGFKNRMRNW